MKTTSRQTRIEREISKYVRIPAGDVQLLADLHVPELAAGLVILAYDFGGSRNHPRTREVASVMREAGFGTLLCDLLTESEATVDEYRNDAEFLAKRLVAVTKWAASDSDTKRLPICYFGACTGGAAVLIAAAKLDKKVKAIVSRGGRPELAANYLQQVKCPTLLIVGERDKPAVTLNRESFDKLQCEKDLIIVPGASLLFGEPGKLGEMAKKSADWLRKQLARS
jgi:putative phosphoribosyl transferase